MWYFRDCHCYMEKHSNRISVQICGCGVLKKLAVNKGNKAKIVVAGGIAVIVFVRMLKEHPISCKIVHEYGCRVSVNLAENNSENQLQIASSDGISVILAVMLEHSKHAGFKAMWLVC